MDILTIRGGKPLRGEVLVEGAKNAALPEMVAALLTSEPVTLENVPNVRDISTMAALLRSFGVHVEHDAEGRRLSLHAEALHTRRASYNLVRTMRASILTLGALLAREGRAEVSLPGGCAIGTRPINLHLEGLEKLGASIAVEHGYVHATAKQLCGAEIFFDTKTVTGTENLMMAASLAEGTTVLQNAACEPEVSDLAGMLGAMGARIEGAGTDVLTIRGGAPLRGVEHRVVGDRIVAGTFLAAAALTRGAVRAAGVRPAHLRAFLDKLHDAGVRFEEADDAVAVRPSEDSLRARDMVTQPYPGIATDLQAQYMALMTQAHGTAVIEETIFENRFMHVSELLRMGADIRLDGSTAVVRGPTPLTGAHVMATDLRASASLVLAGLAAEDETVVHRVYHLDRGYERIEEKLRALGADVERREE
jgi:UDP-N-acetylglucosamine 1-carboxyvinyltransferase